MSLFGIIIIFLFIAILYFRLIKKSSRITYNDKNNYFRYKDSHHLVHRRIAYKNIYLKNRSSYNLPFSKYVIHHKNKNKIDNSLKNLQIVTKEEHKRIHNK